MAVGRSDRVGPKSLECKGNFFCGGQNVAFLRFNSTPISPVLNIRLWQLSFSFSIVKSSQCLLQKRVEWGQTGVFQFATKMGKDFSAERCSPVGRLHPAPSSLFHLRLLNLVLAAPHSTHKMSSRIIP